MGGGGLDNVDIFLVGWVGLLEGVLGYIRGVF